MPERFAGAGYAAGHDLVVIIDFGAQTSQLIARAPSGESNVYCELWPHTVPPGEILRRKAKGIILSSAPANAVKEGSLSYPAEIFSLGIPVLAIGSGMQWMAKAFGGKVTAGGMGESGRARLEVLSYDDLFKGFEGEEGDALTCWMGGGGQVEAAPPGFEVIARTAGSPIAAFRSRKLGLFGLQIHPEVADTSKGKEILANFLFAVCGVKPTWTMGGFIETAVDEIRRRVGSERVVCGLSGGVDSSVAAALVYRAIGDQLTTIFVDHGFLRMGEAEQVEKAFRHRFGRGFVSVDARERFLTKLEGVADPEEKRKRIGEEFIRVFEEEAKKLGDIRFLVQGTLYPDVIESGFGASATIKSHHNVGGLPEKMELELLEPLRFLFKDEVRALGEELGLPEEIVWRQPFPGPGLAIRVIGPIDRERLEIERQADAIVVEEIRRADPERRVWQCFAVLTDTRSVGVMGDVWTYGYTVAVRAVSSADGMTADWVRLPYEALERISSRIMNEVPQVNRVVYDISSKPPATIEWE